MRTMIHKLFFKIESRKMGLIDVFLIPMEAASSSNCERRGLSSPQDSSPISDGGEYLTEYLKPQLAVNVYL